MLGWNAPRLLLLAGNRVPMAGLNMVSPYLKSDIPSLGQLENILES